VKDTFHEVGGGGGNGLEEIARGRTASLSQTEFLNPGTGSSDYVL